jgi:hypothetical protein
MPIAAVGDAPGPGTRRGAHGRGKTRGRRRVVARRDDDDDDDDARPRAAAAAAAPTPTPTAIRVGGGALRVPDPGDVRPLGDHVELAAGLGELLRFVDLAASYACAPALHRGTRGASRSEARPISHWSPYDRVRDVNADP